MARWHVRRSEITVPSQMNPVKWGSTLAARYQLLSSSIVGFAWSVLW